MYVAVISAFVGCFSAMVALAEVQMPNKIVRYLLALLAGALLALLLAWVLNTVAAAFSHVHTG